MAGTITIACACAGGMVTASRPIDTVGRPSPITPLTKPASRKAAATRISRGSDMRNRLTDRRRRHNLELTELAFGYNEGRWPRETAMRFDLVDLQLFVAVAETRSITNGAQRVHLALASASARIKGLEAALGVSLLRRGRRGGELTAAGEAL